MEKTDFSLYDNQLVEVYSKCFAQSESSFFSLGYIMKDLDEFFLFESISEFGTIEGIQIRRKEYISHIETDTSYTKMYDYFISYNRDNKKFDNFDLELLYVLYEELPFEKILNNCMNYKAMISIMTVEEELLTGRIVLLDGKLLILALIDFECIDTSRKKSINLIDIVCIDILSIENFLLTNYLSYKNSCFDSPK